MREEAIGLAVVGGDDETAGLQDLLSEDGVEGFVPHDELAVMEVDERVEGAEREGARAARAIQTGRAPRAV